MTQEDVIKRVSLDKACVSAAKDLETFASCTGCGACMNICPSDAISMKEDEDGFIRPGIDEGKCIECGRCVKICPALHTAHDNEPEPECFAVWAEDATREASSSGGAFSLLAEYVLEQGGYVCGAAFDENFNVRHVLIKSKDDLAALRGSKYVQSNIGFTYRNIKKLLDNGETVLFSGCPCQVAGLKSYLGKDYDNLFTVDLVCHGVPSNAVFKKYLSEYYNVDDISNILFRCKLYGWQSQALRVEKKDGTVDVAGIPQNPFENLFHGRFALREACEYCEFAVFPRQADITLGDFWHVEAHDEALNDKKGTSVVLTNNDKGAALFTKVRDRAKMVVQTPLEAALGNRFVAYLPADRHRGRFFDLLKKYSFKKAAEYAYFRRYDVGIIGNWSVENPGSVLTHYALYCAIREMGLEPLMIERNMSAPAPPRERPEEFENCPYRDYDFSGIFANKADMKKLNDMCDTFILGSDQQLRWSHYRYSGELANMDYIFSNKKKIAYAVSFGIPAFTGTEDERARMALWLRQYDAISVREAEGIKLLKDDFGVDAVQVLEPVFICSPEHYHKLVDKAQKDGRGKHICAYIMDHTEAKERILETVGKEYQTPVRIFTERVYTEEYIKSMWHLPVEYGYTHEYWLGSIKHSDFVITDSFHGTCFSIIFNKPFVCIANEDRGLPRFKTLLSGLGLLDRMVTDINYDAIKKVIDHPIDYERVNIALAEAKAESLGWLKSILDKRIVKPYSFYDVLDRRVDGIDGRINDLYKRTDDMKAFYEEALARHEEAVVYHGSWIIRKEPEIARHEEELKRQEEVFARHGEELKRQEEVFAHHEEELKRQEEVFARHEEELKLQQQRIDDLESRLNGIYNSKTFKLGWFLTYIPRKIRNFFRRR